MLNVLDDGVCNWHAEVQSDHGVVGAADESVEVPWLHGLKSSETEGKTEFMSHHHWKKQKKQDQTNQQRNGVLGLAPAILKERSALFIVFCPG